MVGLGSRSSTDELYPRTNGLRVFYFFVPRDFPRAIFWTGAGYTERLPHFGVNVNKNHTLSTYSEASSASPKWLYISAVIVMLE